MPADKYLPVTGLRFDQVIALSHGHVRYESGVTKYYAPNVQMVYSWTSPEVFTDSRDFYSMAYGYYAAGLTPYSGRVASIGSVNLFVAGRGAKRISTSQDISGFNAYTYQQDLSAQGDEFVTTAGTVVMLGVGVKTVNSSLNTYTSNNSASGGRANSDAVLAQVFMTSALRELDTGVTVAAVASSSVFPSTSGYFAGAPSTLTFSAAQNSANALVVTVPFRSAASSSNAPGMLLAWSQPTGPDETVTNVYRVSVISGGVDVASTFLSTSNIVTVGTGGFVGSIAAASIPTSGSYTVRVEEKIPATYASAPSGYTLDTYAVCCQGVSTVSVSTTVSLTGLDISASTGGGSVTLGGIASVSTVPIATAVGLIDNDWAVQDLQVNLRSRVVSCSLGTVRLKPNDNAILGIVFHDGTNVVDPGATAVRLAVRPASNAGAYSLYHTDTTIVSVSSANYYRMEILANDSDLLEGQAASLLAGSNAAQSLLGEIQWVTTRGTFSSDSFTINAPNEIVREPDV